MIKSMLFLYAVRHNRFFNPHPASQQHQPHHCQSHQPCGQADTFAIDQGGKSQRHKGLQQLHLRHLGHAAQRQTGIPEEKSEILAEQAQI